MQRVTVIIQLVSRDHVCHDQSEIPLSFNGFYGVAVAVERQRAIYTDYSGFASPALGRHISTFRGYRTFCIISFCSALIYRWTVCPAEYA
jgi:hypothetical protein